MISSVWSPDDKEAKETARQARQHGPKTGFLPGHRERLKLVHALIVDFYGLLMIKCDQKCDHMWPHFWGWEKRIVWAFSAARSEVTNFDSHKKWVLGNSCQGKGLVSFFQFGHPKNIKKPWFPYQHSRCWSPFDEWDPSSWKGESLLHHAVCIYISWKIY